MERHEIMELLGQLKLAGMRAAYDEVVAAGLRAQHSSQRISGELLLAQLAIIAPDRSPTAWGRRVSQ